MTIRPVLGARIAAVTLLVLGLMTASARAAAPPPVIHRVVVDDVHGRLTIFGQDLEVGASAVDPIVKLGTVALPVLSSSPAMVTAELPAATPAGRYILTLTRPGVGGTDKLDLSIGIVEKTHVVSFTGLVPPIAGNSGVYVFAGPFATVTTVRPGQRLIGAATAPMGLASGIPQTADVGLCWQLGGSGTITNFLQANFGVHGFTTSRASYSATATVALADPGDYNVGMCVRNNGPAHISNNNYVNGWVMVVD